MSSQPFPLYELIIQATCTYYKVSREELFTKRADQSTIDKKQICFYLIKEMTGLRDTAMSRLLFHSRATIQHSVEKVAGEKDIYRQVIGEINDIKALVYRLQEKQNAEWQPRLSQMIS
ncbi:MAG: hypothetical protein M9904_02265 [Chitinophagaceae bacterium]|nr:hypothetical protein [Chitinophagaceae bacterium]